MPTYRNDNYETGLRVNVTDIDGKLQAVRPGEEVESYRFGVPDLVMISESPVFNPLIARHAVESEGEGDDKEIDLSAIQDQWILVHEVVGGPVAVFLQSAENVPLLAVLGKGESVARRTGNRTNKLVFRFAAAGSCEVIESSEEIM